MDIKKALLGFLQPYIIELILSKVFDHSKRFAFQQMEHALKEIKEYLLEKKEKCLKSKDTVDEEVLSLGISALKEFSNNLNQVLDEVQNS